MRAGPVLVLAAAMALLAACGFRPLYGDRPAGAAPEDLASVRIALISDRSGQILHNYLRDRLNPHGVPDNPAYRLEVDLTENRQELGIRKDETATRVNFQAIVRYRLQEVDALDGVVIEDETRAITAYNIVESEFATIAARDDARDSALRLIADRITTELALYFNSQRERGE